MGHSTITSLFKTSPPERVGLHGEYDHHGLAKRVLLAFHQHVSPHELSRLKVRQRGAVVILSGVVSNPQLLTYLIKVAMTVSGAIDVETNGVTVASSLNTHVTHSSSSTRLPCWN
jgi:hypothetical protein